MLRKLLKQEWKATWKVPAFLVSLVIVCSLASGASFTLPIWDSDWVGVPISGLMVLLLFYFVVIGSSLGVTIYMAVRYYKNMFTDEGYLTHTLPAKSWEILLSKVINMSIWNLISIAAVLVGLTGFIMMLLFFVMPDFSFKEFIYMTGLALDSAAMRGWQTFAVLMILLFLVSSISSVMMIVGAVNIGQLVRKHRILGAIGAYFAIYTVIQMVSMVIVFPVIISKTFSLENMAEVSFFEIYNPMYGIVLVMYLIASVALYFVSEYLLRKKLDLE